jgi:host factor-I protein
MNKTQVNLQDTFLNQVRKENIGVTIYLIGGVQLRGHVRGFDTFTILLDSQGRPTQLVYKSAVTSIVPMRPVNMRDAQAEARREAGGQGQDNAADGTNNGAGAASNGVEGVERMVDGASATDTFQR